jgi:Icc-related predicted phosphoesterase
MIIDCISDLHGHYPKLEGGDLLIVAGDLTYSDDLNNYFDFMEWLEKQKYKRKILIAGNHDNKLVDDLDFDYPDLGIEYLEDSGTEFEGLKIWGSPWTKTFPGMNPNCKAFTVDTEEELAEKWALIPEDVDILITHSPPHGTFDQTEDLELAGSTSLLKRVCEVKPSLHVFGHIHEEGGRQCKIPWLPRTTICVNASHVNEHYQPVNKPIRVLL